MIESISKNDLQAPSKTDFGMSFSFSSISSSIFSNFLSSSPSLTSSGSRTSNAGYKIPYKYIKIPKYPTLYNNKKTHIRDVFYFHIAVFEAVSLPKIRAEVGFGEKLHLKNMLVINYLQINSDRVTKLWEKYDKPKYCDSV